ncbi:hypothetical protein TPA0909_25720 [Streptomyces albus]|nr:hypothetical protein TPA0909_25720 [Streptomyces albus]
MRQGDCRHRAVLLSAPHGKQGATRFRVAPCLLRNRCRSSPTVADDRRLPHRWRLRPARTPIHKQRSGLELGGGSGRPDSGPGSAQDVGLDPAPEPSRTVWRRKTAPSWARRSGTVVAVRVRGVAADPC